MLSDDAFSHLIEYSRWRAVNPSKCPCLDAVDPAACMQGQSFVLYACSRSRPRAARRRRSRSRAVRGKSADPDGPAGPNPDITTTSRNDMRRCPAAPARPRSTQAIEGQS